MKKIIGWFVGIVIVSFFIATFITIFIMIWPTLVSFLLGHGGSQFRMIFNTVFWTLIIVTPLYKGVAWISGR